MSILVINPNSLASVTKGLENTLEASPGTSLHFYTAPSSAPKEIDGTETLILSEAAVLPDLENRLGDYDAFLVCCYSDHPLLTSLPKRTSKPVLGIMQATLLYALAKGTKSVVLTSTSGWNPLLDAAIAKFAGGFPDFFYPTCALDVSVVNLNNEGEFAKIEERVRALLNTVDVKCILLGCAGMAGLDKKLLQIFPRVKFVDSGKAGVAFCAAMMRV